MRSNVDKSAGFIAGDDGGMTVFGMFLTVAFLMMGGYAIDLAHVMAARTQAQITADATAHAALVTRERNPEARAKEVALSIARGNMPPETFGDFIDADAIEFGYWDANTAAFVPQPGARSAVRVSVSRHEDRDNPVPTFLVHLAGLDQWNVTRKAVLVTYQPTCFTEGFVAEGIVDIQSNNSYYNGFCLHSNSHVELNSNNYFEPGTIVSMPNPDRHRAAELGLRAQRRACWRPCGQGPTTSGSLPGSTTSSRGWKAAHRNTCPISSPAPPRQ